MSEIYVFLGPTLAEKEARAELDAVYLPPVSAGDVYRLWQRRPRAVGIVDGYFDRVPAVWHKEIMWMMEHGVHVFGAAGLGALRAAELDSFGMHGAGRVYQAFRDGALDRDDEVAVRHGTADDGYQPLSEAMVNIRSTLLAAQDQGIVSAATHKILLAAGTQLFYPDRTWEELLRVTETMSADAADIEALKRWLPAGRIDQQAADAVAMLREMRTFLAADPAPQGVSWSMADTAMWEVAKRRADTLSGNGAAGSRLMLEPILDEIRLLGPEAFETAGCRSLLRVFAADFAEHEGMAIDPERLDDAVAAFRISRNLEQDAELTRFMADNELSAEDFERLVVTDEMVRWACGQAEWEAFGHLLDDLRLKGEYARLVTRARAKLDDDGRPEAAAGGQAAIEWYFAQRPGTAMPDDLAGYARSCGFADEQAFQTAVRREYQYAYHRPQLRGNAP
jgi:hypothetical protein